MSAPGRRTASRTVSRSEIPAEWEEHVEAFERRFSLRFDSVTEFPKAYLDSLHEEASSDLGSSVVVASASDASIIDDMAVLEWVANTTDVTDSARRSYLDHLLRIYRKLPASPEACLRSGACFVLAPEREGAILARELGWLDRAAGPQPGAKRISFRGGLLVGTTAVEVPKSGPGGRCAVVDGAIASGATLMVFMGQIVDSVSGFDIYAAHAAHGGVRALVKCGRDLGIDVRVFVGHISGRLNEKYYAVDPDDPDRLVVGDLGDTIAPIAGAPGP